jgi:hypothetical protein
MTQTMRERDPADALFEQLRLLVLAAYPSAAPDFVEKMDLVPIEGSWDGDGWVCMSRDGEVGFLDAEGRFDPRATFAVPKTAIIGSLARRFPLASWYIPRCANPRVCPDCQGSGKVFSTVPEELEALAERFNCRCGGLGWISTDGDRR